MEIKTIALNQLEVDNRFDTKFENEYMINKLRVSLQRHGQTSLLHVIKHQEGSYSVISGKRILRLLRELGVPEAQCQVHANYQEALMVCLSLDSIRFSIDYFKVADQVKELNTLDVKNQRIQHSVSWSKEELDNMLKMAQFDWEKFGEPDVDANQISLF